MWRSGSREGDASVPSVVLDWASALQYIWVHHIGPGEKTFAFIPMSHCCFSLIKEAMKTTDKTYGFDFSFSSNGRLYHESQSHQNEPLAALYLIHLVCVKDKANFRAILPTLLSMDPMGVGSRITSRLLIFVNSISVEIQLMWESETPGH